MTSSHDIRQTFLKYFAQQDHTVVPSSSLVPHNDPSILFTNAGMVPFKNVFTGHETRPYIRATSAQKVVRAGGKHNDLANVGYTARHHTFFEMLGNFSFGDYFKPQAIEMAWQLLTREFDLPIDRLLVTVYSEDEAAAALWRQIAGLPDARIIRIPTNDNFWRMGESGPCGPCSEIFFDHGDHIPGGPPGSPNEDGDRFVEIWNLVFMQFFEDAPGIRHDLPRPSIDTGMGLERIAAVLQGTHTNYDTDIFRALILASADLTGQDPDGACATHHRVVADHLRSAAFLIADGVRPSVDGRGSVLRRILRRAQRHVHLLGVQAPLLDRLVPTLVAQMGDAYPELGAHSGVICHTLQTEALQFQELLERGLGRLDQAIDRLGTGETLPGAVAFELHDTFGFPLDVTEDVLRARGHAVDRVGFDASMEAQRLRARAGSVGRTASTGTSVWLDLREHVGATEFLGYADLQAEATVTALLVDGISVVEATSGMVLTVVLDATPFYGAAGGQIGDRGGLHTTLGLQIEITDTQRPVAGVVAHMGRVTHGTVRVGDRLTAQVDAVRRAETSAHHSATHLLHAALRDRMGLHVEQHGSLNTPDRLRFDVSHPRPMTEEELVDVAAAVNAQIRHNSSVITQEMSLEQATQLGAMALFGNTYGARVRVVSMGTSHTTDTSNTLDATDPSHARAYSIELCGGTHVQRTGALGFFRIVSETGISAGVRRIEAVVGRAAEDMALRDAQRLSDIAALLRVPETDVVARVTALLAEQRTLEQQMAALLRKGTLGASKAPVVEHIDGVAFSGHCIEGVLPKDLKGLAEDIGQQIRSGVVAVVGTHAGTASVVVWVSADCTDRLDAVALVRTASPVLGGKGGGGRRDLAQAGGPNASFAQAALDAIRTNIAT